MKTVPLAYWGGCALNLDDISYVWHGKNDDNDEWQVRIQFKSDRHLNWNFPSQQAASNAVREIANLATANVIVEEFS